MLFPLRAFGAQEAKHVSGTAPLGLQAPHVLSASIQSRAGPGGGAGSSPVSSGPWDWGRSRFQSPSSPGAPAQHVGRRALGLGEEQVPVPVSSRQACPAHGAPGPGTGGGAGSSPCLVVAHLPSTWGAEPCLPHSLRFPPGPWLSFPELIHLLWSCLYHSSAPNLTSFLQPLLNLSLCVFCPCFLSSG